MIKELQVNPPRIGTILTAVCSDLKLPVENQVETVIGWCGMSSRIFVHTGMNLHQHDGLRPVYTESKNPRLRDVIAHYAMSIPGNEVFAICQPNITISKDIIKVLEHADSQKFQVTWSSYAFAGQNVIPSIFVMTASVMPHFINDIPTNISMGTDEWGSWLHGWMKQFMQAHRYFDVTSLGFAQIVALPPEPAPEAKSPEPLVLTPITPQIAPEVPLRPKKRQRGTK